jgi:Ca2+-binding RTX toxin-like protein
MGGSGKDIVRGGTLFRSLGGSKNVAGGNDNDVVLGGKGSDKLMGQEGNDFLSDGEFENAVKDDLFGGTGNDVLDAINKTGVTKDVVACGSGFDRVIADSKDVVAPDCERVTVGLRNVEAFYDSIPQSFWDGLAYPIGPQYPSKPGDYAKAQGLAEAFEKANVNPFVGDWRRNLRCAEYERRMKQAGLADMLHDNPCQGKDGRQHDHIFYRDGRFTSVGATGAFQDNGHYILPNDHTIVFPGSGSKTFPPVTAHFRFSDHLNTVTFDLVVPKNLDECSDRCQETYEWAVSVFYSGLPWHRVCQADNDDNNILGRTDELGEPCWVDPMEIENRLD